MNIDFFTYLQLKIELIKKSLFLCNSKNLPNFKVANFDHIKNSLFD